MRPKQVQIELRNLLALLLENGIALFVKPVVLENYGVGRSRLRWSRSAVRGGRAFYQRFGTIDEYFWWIENEDYSAILRDGAIVQISYDFDSDVMIGHRLLYYPCPFDLDTSLLVSQPIVDVLDMYRSHGTDLVRLRSAIRFDFDTVRRGVGHPASHATLLAETCRWAVTTPLSVGHFVRFVFGQFYPTEWRQFPFLRSWPQHPAERTITDEETELLHIGYERRESVELRTRRGLPR